MPEITSFVYYVQQGASTCFAVFDAGAHLARIILGGLVLWACVVIARYILNGSTFRSRGRRR